MKNLILFALTILTLSTHFSCQQPPKEVKPTPFFWESANLYFLLTDRFNNGDTVNDINFNRTDSTAVLRGFEGGDIKGITQKIEDGYFNNLGINAIWFTPVLEQIHGSVDEGTGNTYAFHGYWTKDWTALDPNFGSKEDLKTLVETAHSHGIRIVMDAVINHTGPVTDNDPVWPDNWVRTEPQCNYQNYESTVTCTLVKNLPDIKTESNQAVELPPQLVEKWKEEGRYEQEMEELDAFFERTGYPRAPRFYIMKWLTDYILEFGIDAYRADTVKHTEESVWLEFKKECEFAFAEWKKNHPEKVLDQNEFKLIGEVYNYNVSSALAFDFGDKKVNYFDYGFDGMINFEFKYNAQEPYETLFSRYDQFLQGELKNYVILNYLSSHDDGAPFDKLREKPIETANKLLLSPGVSQVYYGDELARLLVVDGAEGDANLRSKMDWQALNNQETAQILSHWQKLGQFRKAHPAIGAGKHQIISESPYYFSRSFEKNDFSDKVVVGLELEKGEKSIPVKGIFNDGATIRDAYSGQSAQVKEGILSLSTPYNLVLLEKTSL